MQELDTLIADLKDTDLKANIVITQDGFKISIEDEEGTKYSSGAWQKTEDAMKNLERLMREAIAKYDDKLREEANG